MAESAGYKDYRGFNLQYGLLARRIGEVMQIQDARISLLVEFTAPKSLKNQEWLIFMRPEFAAALKCAGWI